MFVDTRYKEVKTLKGEDKLQKPKLTKELVVAKTEMMLSTED